VFELMVTNSRPKLSEADVTIEIGIFKCVTIKEMGKVLLIICRQFFLSLANNLQSRLIMTTSVHSSMTGKNTKYDCYIELLNNINILHFENWPYKADIQYGKENIRKICKKPSSVERCIIVVSASTKWTEEQVVIILNHL
jgi:hypothetical protein